jgi:hypothetical protein
MAALLHDHRPPTPAAVPAPVARFFALEVVPDLDPAPAPEPRPQLRVLPGGADARRVRRPAAVYRRRRIAVLAVAVAVLTLLAIAAAVASSLAASSATEAVDADGAPPVEAPSPAAAAVAPEAALTGTYVVQPGDTLWHIATDLDPSGDVRALVDDLADLAGPGPLEAGQRLDLTQLDR